MPHSTAQRREGDNRRSDRDRAEAQSSNVTKLRGVGSRRRSTHHTSHRRCSEEGAKSIETVATAGMRDTAEPQPVKSTGASTPGS